MLAQLTPTAYATAPDVRPPSDLPVAANATNAGAIEPALMARAARISPPAAPPPDFGSLLATLAGDLVVFAEPRPRQATAIVLAAAVSATPEALRAQLQDVAFFRRAIPWIVRAETLAERGEAGGARAQRLLAWELEVPLWNLDGKLWFRPTARGIEIELVEGDLAPGRFVLSALPGPAGAVLHIEARANLAGANFVTRRLAARDPRSEAAMTATAAYVLLRAVALEASGRAAGTRWPKGGLAAPAPEAFDGAPLGRIAAARFPARQVVALVRSRRDGRLDHVAVAVPAVAPLEELAARIRDPQTWRALPGWKEIEVKASGAAADRWTVDSSMPFVDFDAIWSVHPGPPFRARSIGDDWVGAALRWDLVPDAPHGRTLAVLSFHGHVERTGYLPRRLVDAEPLLEHALSLGLAYINGLSLVRAGGPP